MTGDPRTDYANLIPELSKYRESGPWAIDVWLANIGRYDASIGYASLFWPSFTEVDDCVLLGPGVPEEYGSWKVKNPDDPSAIESVLNHRHLRDLFPTAPKPSRSVLLHLGSVLREMWIAKLHRDFPDRRFVVSLHDRPPIHVDDPQISFHTERDQVIDV